MLRPIIAFTSILIVSACSASGARYSLTSVPKDKSEIVVYRSSSLPMRSIDVTVDGQECGLQPKGYFRREVEPNSSVTVTADTWDAISSSKASFSLKPGERLFLNIGNRTSAVGLVAVGGLLGNAASTDGIYAISAGNEAEASDMKESCK